ncbi:hypothetical protein HDC94_001150 [Leifsonia sp. AK011]|uniref:glycosyltransferase family 2 protein n=1 Tax=Leifsonia sp. AK011 TaxID=2723075 RepID=UPI0015C733DD|nr:glycosyltransferase [Leifsonia sp. AK011]NYF09994.1 hypothetical protein [Leifsonia sp. AK011]
MTVPPTRATVAVVISTLGRVDALAALLGDLAAQTRPPLVVAVCDQSNDPESGVSDVCDAHRDRLDIRVVTSPRGLSRGRNAAAAAVRGEADYLFFPNDTSRLGPDALERFRPRDGVEAFAGQYRDAHGARTHVEAGLLPLAKNNVWAAMEPALFVRSDAFTASGGFDETLGSGASTPWQSGEGTELLLRLGRAGGRIQFDPDLVVEGVPESEGLDRAQRQRKLRAYGRGYGHILREWNYGARRRWAAVLGGFALGIRQPRRFTLGDGWHVGLGRAEGIMNRTLGTSTTMTAVDR